MLPHSESRRSSYQLLSTSSGEGSTAAPTSSVLHEIKSRIGSTRTLTWNSGITCAAIACVIFSFSSLQVKLTGGRVPILQLCIIRSGISFCTSIAFGTASGIKPLFGRRQHFPLLFMRGCCGMLAIGSYYVSLLTLPLGDAVTISQMKPPFTAVMARLLLNESLGFQGAIGCLLSVAGVITLAHPPFLFGGHSDWSHRRLIGTLCGVISTLCATGTSYAVRRIGTREPSLVVALWFHTTTVCIMVWPLLAAFPEPAKLMSPHDCLLLLGIGGTSFCAQLLMTRSFQLIAAARAAAVSFTGVIYSHILGALIFDEQLAPATLAGGVLIFAGVLLVTLRSSSSSGSGSSSSSSSSSSSNAVGLKHVGDTNEMTPFAADTRLEGDNSRRLQQQQQQGGTSVPVRWEAAAAALPAGSNSNSIVTIRQPAGQQAAPTPAAAAAARRPSWLQRLLQQDTGSEHSTNLDHVHHHGSTTLAAAHPLAVAPVAAGATSGVVLRPLCAEMHAAEEESFDHQQPPLLRSQNLSWASWGSWKCRAGASSDAAAAVANLEQQQQQQLLGQHPGWQQQEQELCNLSGAVASTTVGQQPDDQQNAAADEGLGLAQEQQQQSLGNPPSYDEVLGPFAQQQQHHHQQQQQRQGPPTCAEVMGA